MEAIDLKQETDGKGVIEAPKPMSMEEWKKLTGATELTIEAMANQRAQGQNSKAIHSFNSIRDFEEDNDSNTTGETQK